MTNNSWRLDPLKDITYPILTLIIIITNSFVVWSSELILSRGHQKKRSTYLFLGNLSITTIILGVLRQITFWFTPENTDHLICKFIAAFAAVSLTANLYSVGLIAIDRYLFITHGMQYERWVYPNRARLLIGGTWLIGVLLGTMPFIWWNELLHPELKSCSISSFANKKYEIVRITLICIPIVIVAISYSVILSKALWKLRQMEPGINEDIPSPSGRLRIHMGSVISINNNDIGIKKDTSLWSLFSKSASLNTEKKWKAVNIVLLTTLVLIITWVPFTICYLIFALICGKNKKENPQYCFVYPQTLRPMFYTMAIIHDLVTPIIYVWWHKGFKNFFIKLCATKK